ncbi:hypothetical protein [Hymenobacter sp. DG25B]|uniref:hypothetical protein n=1 Tax=Hymenobacter sp. DG25B TaxID=1385664 RepID=UPI0012E088E3|nr:hypothetical protein [Hymenobacter sp. DG25B]
MSFLRRLSPLAFLLFLLACKAESADPTPNVQVRITGLHLRPEWGGHVMIAHVTQAPGGGRVL